MSASRSSLPSDSSIKSRGEVQTWVDRAPKGTRFSHNLFSILFTVALASGLILQLSFLQSWLGHRLLVRNVHIAVSLLAFVVGAIAFTPLGGAKGRKITTLFSTWFESDSLWMHRWIDQLRRPPYSRSRPNAGQKLLANSLAGSMVSLLASGIVLWLFRYFPPYLRIGSTLAHQLFYYLATILVLGHIALVILSSERLKRKR